MIRLVKATKTYAIGGQEVTALAGVDLSVEKSEFVAIMGASGSGKSTLLHLIGGLDRASSGQVLVEGLDICSFQADALTMYRREKVGFVFQAYNLMPELSVFENVALPIMILGNRTDLEERVGEMLELVNLEHRSNHKPNQLSGGEQQRAAIARALIKKPAVVLADEPTGNLDAKSSLEIVSMLRRSAGKLGQTVMMVTHDKTDAQAADRIILLGDGKVLSQEVLQHG